MSNIDKFLSWAERLGEKNWGIALFFFLPIFLPLAKILVGGQVLADGDALSYHYPVYSAYAQMLQKGQFTLWNPLNFSGFPTFLISVARFFSPINILFFRYFSPLVAYNWLIFFNLFLGALFTSFFLKKLNIPLWGRFIGGLTYIFGQWPIVGDLTVAYALPLLPLLFITIWGAAKEHKRLGIVWGGLIIGMAWLSVHFQWTVMLLTAGGVFTLYLALSDRHRLRNRLAILASYASMVILGSLVGLAQLWPAYLYANLSGRAGGLSYAQAATGALWPTDYIKFLLPSFTLPFFGSAEILYVGALALFLAVIGFVARQNRESKFFTWFSAGCLLMSPKLSPLFWIVSQLPVYSYFRGPTRWMFLGYFAAAVLAGFGLKALTESKMARGRDIVVKIYGWVVIAISLSIAVASIIFGFLGSKTLNILTVYCDIHLFNKVNGVPLEFYNSVIHQAFRQLQEIISWHNPLFFWPFLFLILGYVLLWSTKRYHLNPGQIARLSAAIITLNFAIVTGFYFQTVSAKASFKEPKTAIFLKSQPPGRVMTLLPSSTVYTQLTVPFNPTPADTAVFESAMLEPNGNLLYNIESADYYDNIMSDRMSKLLALIGSDRATTGTKLADENIPWTNKIKKFVSRKPILDELGIRYVISAFPLEETKFKKIFETTVTRYALPIVIYENEQARPKIYLADKAMFIVPSKELSYREVVSGNLRGRDIIVECTASCLTTSSPATGTAEILEQKSGHWKIKTQTTDDRWLVVSENFLPGWKAYLDGKATVIHFANSVFMGIAVPPGDHTVSLSFSWPGI